VTPPASRADALATLRLPCGELPSPLLIPTPRGHGGTYSLDAGLRPPGSKSLANRALLLAALARGTSRLRNIPRDADDTRQMIAALRALGAGIDDAGPDLAVTGVAGRWRPLAGPVTLDVNNAGTAARFLAAAAMLSPVPVTIDGNDRMRERPIAELAEALVALGAHAEHPGAAGCPPLRLTPPATLVPRPSPLTLATTQSSQFISGLLLVAPFLPGGLTLRLTGEVTSAPYVSMTLALLARLGASVRSSDDLRVLRVGPPDGGGPLPAFDYEAEPDASAATYWWAAGAILPGARVRVPGLGPASLQGDTRFPELLERLGATITRRDLPEPSVEVTGPARLRPILADLSDTPDAAMTLAACACFAEGTSVLRGLRTLRVKETDRVEAIRAELSRLGVRVECRVAGDPDALTITPPPAGLPRGADAPRVELETYRDHRMAMSLALIGLRRPNTFVKDPACVAKTYPAFWSDLATLLGGSPLLGA
jgi:3-phosphoshikimate 1-carboxyvinyltransferase